MTETEFIKKCVIPVVEALSELDTAMWWDCQECNPDGDGSNDINCTTCEGFGSVPPYYKVKAELASKDREIAALKEALEPFVAFLSPELDRMNLPDSFAITNGSSLARKQLTLGDLRRARSAHEGKT